MAAFALPELLPNKWRHIGVVIADLTVYVAVIVAPVTARYGYEFGTWAWNFWALAIFQALSFLGLLFLYHPPKHPYETLNHCLGRANLSENQARRLVQGGLKVSGLSRFVFCAIPSQGN